MQPDKMSREQLLSVKVESGNRNYIRAGAAWFVTCILGAVVLNAMIDNFFEGKITLFIAVCLVGIIGYFKYLFPRLGWLEAGVFIIALVVIEAIGHTIEVKNDFAPALLIGHIAVEVLALPFCFTIFARWYLKKKADANTQYPDEMQQDEDADSTKK